MACDKDEGSKGMRTRSTESVGHVDYGSLPDHAVGLASARLQIRSGNRSDLFWHVGGRRKLSNCML